MKRYFSHYFSISRLSLLCLCLLGSPCQAHTTNLIQAYRQAIVFDPLYLQAQAAGQAIGYGVGQSRADLLPQINSTASAQRSYDLLKPDQQQYSDGVNVALTQTIFNWSYWKNLSYAKLLGTAAQLNTLAQQQNLIQRLAVHYFTVSLDQKQISLDRREIKNEMHLLKSVRVKYKAGKVYRVELDNALSSLARTKASLLSHQVKLVTDRNKLREIVGMRIGTVSSLKKIPFLQLRSRREKDWLRETLADNVSINSARFNVRAAKAKKHSIVGGYLPSVQASTTYQYGRTLDEGEFSTSNHGLTLGLSLSWKLWQSGKTYYSVQRQAALDVAARQQLSLQVATFTSLCRSAFTRTIQDELQIKLNRQVMQIDKRAYKHTLDVYQRGVSQYKIEDVLWADEKYYRAEYNLLASEYDYLNAVIQLREAGGHLSISTLLAVNRWLS